MNLTYKGKTLKWTGQMNGVWYVYVDEAGGLYEVYGDTIISEKDFDFL